MPETCLGKDAGIEMSDDLFSFLECDFHDAVDRDRWFWSEEDQKKDVEGTLCENVERTGDEGDSIVIPICDGGATDGGYVEVFGWREKEQ